MDKENSIKIFNDKKIRTKWDEELGDYWYSLIDVIAVLTESKNPSAYWRKLKQRLKKEQNEIVKKCHSLKMPSNDGKMRLTDVTSTNNLISLLDTINLEYNEDFIDWLNKTRLEQLYS